MTPTPSAQPLLDATRAAFLGGPVAINVASRSARLVPSVARAFGCRVCDDRLAVVVFLAVPRARALLRDLHPGAPVAAIFSRPKSHESLQLKGDVAAVRSLESGERAIMRAYGALDGLERHCDIHHALALMMDPGRQCLYTVASRGYPQSGIGSEVRLGEGIVGVAARERTPIRLGYAVQEYRYSHAMRQRFADSGDGVALETEIPLPGLANAGSQLAVPMVVAGRLLGVLYVESPLEQRFTYRDEDALVVLAGNLALCLELLAQSAEQPAESAAAPAPSVTGPSVSGAPILIRHFAADHSVFVDHDYLIKGVAGAIIWKLLCEHVEVGRTEFTNRELRLDVSLKLPDIHDNLDARLILLQRRLAERCPVIALEKTGRGRFRLNVSRPLQLAESAG
jgi:hypothetical protein